jgi:hypothetical protein
LETALPDGGIHKRSGMRQSVEALAYAWNAVLDRGCWFAIRAAVAPWNRLAPSLKGFFQRFPVLWRVLQILRSGLR